MIIVLMGSSTALAQGPPPAKVVMAEITRQEVAENRPFLGLLYYDRISHVSSEVAGLVDGVAVREGDRVKSGSDLLGLDTKILEREIALVKTRIAQVQLRIEQAEKNVTRLERLFAEDGASEKNYEDVRYAFEDFVKEKQVYAEELDKLLITKEKSVIKAPFSGVILEKNVDTGDWVQQGKELVRIGSTDDLFVRVPVSEDLLQFITDGERVVVIIQAFAKEVEGIIEDFDPVADPKTKNVFLKVRIPEMTKVAENMSAQVYVPTSLKKTFSLIPRDALIKFQGGDFVYTVKEGKASILPAHIVTYLGNNVAVDNPHFEPGMKVVVEGNERLRPDQPVVVAGEN
jgi:RND family efflux transporter MFP subunit